MTFKIGILENLAKPHIRIFQYGWCTVVALILWYTGLIDTFFENICIGNSPFFFVGLLLMLSNLFGYTKFFCTVIWDNKHAKGNQYKWYIL